MRRLSSVLIGCATVCAAACVAGGTVDVVSASPTGVTYEYTHSYSTEYTEAVKKAEGHCQAYQKHARPVGQPVRINLDRSVATFECV